MPKGQQSLSAGATSGVKTFTATIMVVLSFLCFFFLMLAASSFPFPLV